MAKKSYLSEGQAHFLDSVGKIQFFRIIVIIIFLVITTVQRVSGARPLISWNLLYLIFSLLVISLVFDWAVRKTRIKEKKKFSRLLYAIYLSAEITIVMAILHLGGTIFYSGIIFLALYLLIPYFSFTENSFYRWIVITVAVIAYCATITLEHLGIIVPPDVLGIGKNIIKNREVYMTVLTSGMPLLIGVVVLIHNFMRRLQNSLSELRKKEIELQESKNILEIKVRARTRQLREQAESLKEENEKKTKNLKERIEELEKFHRFTVGREMKMVELKKKIKELQKGAGEEKE